MKTNKLTYSTPIPKIKEYVHNIVKQHNAGTEYPCILNEISQLFFTDEKEARSFIKEWFTQGKDYTLSERKVLLSANCLRRLFDMASMGLTPKQK
jgi:heterodisulfide reductase subunit B